MSRRGETLQRAPARRRLRVALVKPPLRVPLDSYTTLACPPLNLAYLGATLLDEGCEVTIVDAVGEAPFRMDRTPNPAFLRVGLSDDEIVRRIPRDADLIGVTAMFSEEWPLVRDVTRALRTAFPAVPLIAGGEHATAAPEFCLRDSGVLDLCVLGEGEETLRDLARRLRKGEEITGVFGTAARQDGEVRVNPPRPRIRAVDDIPPPAWHLVRLDEYFRHQLSFGLKRGRTLPLLMSRGCPYRCSFCSNERMWTTRWLPRSPGHVVDEMRRLVETFDVQNFDIFDSTAIQRRDWIVEFCSRLIESGLGVTWQIPAGTRTEVLDGEVTRLLYASGCRYLAYAPESGSPDVLRRIRKRLDLARMKDSMRAALRAGIRVKCNLMIGFPDESPAEMLKTTALMADLALLGVHDVNVGPVCPYPGSALYDALAAQGRIPALDDDFLDALASYSDLGRARSFNASVPSAVLEAARLGDMAVFYGTSFALRPWRLARLVADLATGGQDTRLARALSDLLARRRLALTRSLRSASTRGPRPARARPRTGGSSR